MNSTDTELLFGGDDSFINHPCAEFDPEIFFDLTQGDGDAVDRRAADKLPEPSSAFAESLAPL
jgi:hypothetical protein